MIIFWGKKVICFLKNQCFLKLELRQHGEKLMDLKKWKFILVGKL